MKVLYLDLEGVLEKFSDERVLLLEDLESKQLIEVTIPRLPAIVELPYTDETERDRIIDQLFGIGCIRQETRVASRVKEGG